MNLQIFQVDSFTENPFLGNPAAVCILPEPIGSEWMQKIAQEMNLSETAFLYKYGEGFNLRWFTPTVEVDLCGHATLASAHVLWNENYLRPDQVAKFYTKSGLLTGSRLDGWIELDFPAEPDIETVPPDGLLLALGVHATYVGMNRFDYIIEVQSEKILRELEPDFKEVGKLTQRGIIVTTLGDSSEFDFVSRYFDPGEGINEDPVTGSAHCCLGPYWKNRLGKKEFIAYQASSRGGVVKLRVEKERVHLLGQAITVLKGELIFLG